jgi:hypothetical protein
MNSRFICDVVAIIITFWSGVGVFMLSGLLGTNSTLSFWLMILYTIFTSILLCNCCNCSLSAKKVCGIIDTFMRFFTVIFTGLAIQDLKDFKEEYLNSDDSFAVAVEAVIDAAIDRIAITLVLQIMCLLMTLWWVYELRRKTNQEQPHEVATANVELATAGEQRVPATKEPITPVAQL